MYQSFLHHHHHLNHINSSPWPPPLALFISTPTRPAAPQHSHYTRSRVCHYFNSFNFNSRLSISHTVTSPVHAYRICKPTKSLNKRKYPASNTSHPMTTMSQHLRDKTAVITGATRGIGRGIAIALAEQGAHVIITGRTETGPNSLLETCKAVVKAGGTCKTYCIDHACDKQVTSWFHTLSEDLRSSDRRLDLFVNNAFSGVHFIRENVETPFWNKTLLDGCDDPAAVWDVINQVGLRGNYICSVFATRIMEQDAHGGIIANITSWGGLVSIFDPAYSIGKAGIDRMNAEFALSAPENIDYLTLCPGFVGTDSLRAIALEAAERMREEGLDERSAPLPLWNMETPLFVGRVLAACVWDRDFAAAARGKVAIASEVADRFQINDENGFRALSFRSLRFHLMKSFPSLIESPLRHIVPRSLCVPWPLVQYAAGALKHWN